jgi:putative addiction module component (TIGR02574 family)
MGTAEIAKCALELPPEERLELARRLVESVVMAHEEDKAVREGIQRIEDLASGRVQGLSEEDFRTALK